ncbi:Glutathione hydrolase proenzyme 2 [Cucumispora dikerogammari]|nr:Glutathione hydrolase proenzyme 2 [Cucumispora dikerogammari]
MCSSINPEIVYIPRTKSRLRDTNNIDKTQTRETFLPKDPTRNQFVRVSNTFSNGAVATEVPICSEIGVKILKMGGNAVDAGIAATICVGIINSFSSGIGGGGFALYRDRKNGKTATFDFRECAPKRIHSVETRDDFSLLGGSSVGVPGEVYGLYKAKRKYGSSAVSWESLFTENINIAKNGFLVSKELAKRIEKFKEYIKEDPGLREIYYNGDEPVKEGDTVYRKNLAYTLEKISKNPFDFYRGELMKNMVDFIQEKNGVISSEDFKNYKVRILEDENVQPEKILGYDVYTTPLPSSGIFLILGLNIFENYGIDDFKKKDEKEQVNILVEIMKYMFLRRGEFGDSKDNKYENLAKEIKNKVYAREIYKQINNNRIKTREEYKMTKPFSDNFGTSQINVMDSEGRVFAINTSINLEFGGKIMDPQTGIVFNNQINDFFIPKTKENIANTELSANIATPERRPLSSMCPIILESDDEDIVIGAAGGTRILTSVFLTLINTLLGKSITESITAKRIHHQFEPYKVFYEPGFSNEAIVYLQKKGNVVEKSEIHAIFTSVQGIKRKGIYIEAFSDKRKGGEAAGY